MKTFLKFNLLACFMILISACSSDEKDLDSTLPDNPDNPDKVDYAIEIPEYDKSMIYDIIIDGEKKAEICREYVRSASVDSVLNVIYKIDSNGDAITNKGYLMNGTELVWDETNNIHLLDEIGELTNAQTHIDNEGELFFDKEKETASAELKPQFLIDDRSGNAYEYKVVKIGKQYWMAENLRATKYIDGTKISTNLNPSDWASATEPTVRSYREADAAVQTEYKELIGLLYNPIAASDDKIAPEGWRISLDEDWEILIDYLGEDSAGKVKVAGTDNWGDVNSDEYEHRFGNNRSGFTVLPGGYYGPNGVSLQYGMATYFWAPKKDDQYNYFVVSYANDFEEGIDRNSWSVNGGYSLRCVKK